MAWIRAHSVVPWCCLLLAMALVMGERADATRPNPAPVRTTTPSQASGTCPDPPLVNVDLNAYAGVWYEIGSTAQFKARTEAFLVCSMARYSLVSSGVDAGKVRVRNEGYNTTLGEPNVVIGSAIIFAPGKLGVSFAPGAPPGDYRIIYLSGSAKEYYRTAIIYSCDESGQDNDEFQSLYILSREPELSDHESLEELLKFVAKRGIVLEKNNQFVLTPQDDAICGRKF